MERTTLLSILGAVSTDEIAAAIEEAGFTPTLASAALDGSRR